MFGITTSTGLNGNCILASVAIKAIPPCLRCLRGCLLLPYQRQPLTPRSHFRDITAQAGIHFTHNNGAFGKKWLPETMGPGCAFIDYDNDGYPDILLVNGQDWPGHAKAAQPRSSSTTTITTARLPT